MEIHHQELPDVTRYIDNHRHISLDDHEKQFRFMLRYIERYHDIGPGTEILEIGTGTGWFPILCKKKGLRCRGLEISPQLVEFAHQWGASEGAEPDIVLGNLEETDLGVNRYDVIFASSVFEHVEQWRLGLKAVHRALKPGGVLFFESTNKFAPVSAEYDFPLYGWLPDSWRYRLRISRQGPEIMKLGIDFNQFTYPLLRRTFRELGFSQIFDRVELTQPDWILKPWKRRVLGAAKQLAPLRHLTLLFMEVTTFVCIK